MNEVISLDMLFHYLIQASFTGILIVGTVCLMGLGIKGMIKMFKL